MSDTVWVLVEGQEDDDFDHSLLLREAKKLDNLAEALARGKLGPGLES